MKFIKKIINKFKFKMGKTKIEIGKEYRVIPTPCGKTESRWNHSDVSAGATYIVKIDSVKDSCDNSYNVSTISKNGHKQCTMNNGWLYDYEMVSLAITVAGLGEEIQINQERIDKLTSENKTLGDKIKFMQEHGVENFNEEEFKAYLVLKELGIDDIQKAKNIIKILGK